MPYFVNQKSERAIQDPDVMNVLNEGWLPDSLQLYEDLSKLTDSGQWEKLPIKSNIFSKSPSIGRPGQILESACFGNKKECKAVGVCQFGPLAQGPPGAIPLQTAILMEAEIEEDGERKVKLSSRLKSADGSILYTEGSLIFVKLRVPVSKL
ncbi:acyl-coenzyme A thioesterase THEM4-like [Glandiceps talaboti]